MGNVAEVREALPRKFLPIAKGSELCLSDRRSRDRLAIAFTLAQPFDEISTGLLTRFCWCKENLLKDCESLEFGIAEIFCETWLIEVHDVFATSGCRADEDHPTKN